MLSSVDLDDIRLSLPMARKDDDSFGFHFLGNLPPDILEDWIDGVVRFVLHIRLFLQVRIMNLS